ncbi:hypothetical protein JHK82_037620 [Glycine max]|nr:hypothetical protein JHK82_037620 [Glycine max]
MVQNPNCNTNNTVTIHSGKLLPWPSLVSPKEIPAPKDSGLPLNAYMLHNPAHVELNAIDLAWDTVVRFSPFIEILGEGFFADFAHVSDDESRHFSWCAQRLAELDMVICQPTIGYGGNVKNHQTMLGCTFGCDPTSPGTPLRPSPSVFLSNGCYHLEAGGLDAGPRLVKKLVGFGDNGTSKIVARIADEEVAHVAVGVYWFDSICEKLNCAPDFTFKDLLKEYNVELKGPFNYSARDESGIPGDWYDDASSASTKDKKDKDGNQKQLSAALGFSLGSSLRLSRPPRLNSWPRRLDSWAIVDMHMPLLFVRNSNSGVCVGVGEGSTACYGVVHLSDPLLATFCFHQFRH